MTFSVVGEGAHSEDSQFIRDSWRILVSWLKGPSKVKDKLPSECQMPLKTLEVIIDSPGINDTPRDKEAYVLDLSPKEAHVRAKHIRGVVQGFKTLLLLFLLNGMSI
eukprot:gnl/MRDRNA2_/MRDRNA2_54625_c0_seq1.p1 gnl/MRDRNA2_/MRDRNA2_54625_c0~~gnl/MRDRNA2_/MRDRNA2_54625_c0_seq1.p1  ORF type:complete len:121 (+),score=17.50 gnl/MRDRNA2_/MRDRNA2_54625_c0_seq1:44-364(+)